MPRTTLSLAMGAALILSVLSAGPALGSATPPPPPSTTTPSAPSQGTVEQYLRDFINKDRAARGLRALRLDSRLQSVARERAATLADLGMLSHSAAGDITSELAGAGVQWYSWGEDLGWSSYSWGYDVAKSLYALWKGSASHFALMMSSNYNYFAVGVGYRWSGRSTYASIIFSDSADHTRPVPAMTGLSRTGTTIGFRWRGSDVLLQRRTSGLRNFDVEYRQDGGPWSIVRSGTTSTSITLAGRIPGHYYWVAVRARDRAGNVSAWTAPLHVWVP
jgi:uncharacterized protein YkwD